MKDNNSISPVTNETFSKAIEKIDKRFEEIDRRFEKIDKRFEAIDRRFEAIDRRFDAQDQKLNEAVDAIVEGMDRIAKEILEHEDREHEKIRQEIRIQGEHTRDEINGLKADLARVPSREEFEDVKSRLQKLERAILQQ